jgi:hypothetical protein
MAPVGRAMARHGSSWHGVVQSWGIPWDTSNLPYIYTYIHIILYNIIIYVLCWYLFLYLQGNMMIDNGKFGLGFSHIWETYLGETYIYISKIDYTYELWGLITDVLEWQSLLVQRCGLKKNWDAGPEIWDIPPNGYVGYVEAPTMNQLSSASFQFPCTCIPWICW